MFKLDHVSIMVTSLDESIPYYDALLALIGFDKLRDHVWSDGKGFYLQFREAESKTPPYARYGAGMNHLGFHAPDAAMVEHIRASMIRSGFEAPEIVRLGGAAGLFMKDPDGIRFEVTYYPEGFSPVE